MAEFRVSLDQDDFAKLIRGDEVRRPITVSLDGLIPFTGVRVALRDIGWTVMIHEIMAAVNEANP